MFSNLPTIFKKSIFFGFILAVSFFTCVPLQADVLNQDIVAGMPRNFPPHFFLDKKTGKPSGFGVDVMDAIAQQCGLNISYRTFDTWKETNQAAMDGIIDIIPNQGFTSERESFLDFTSPYETFRINFYTRATTPGLNSLADIRSKKIGVVVTNKAHFILENQGGYHLVKYDTFEELIMHLMSGDVDTAAVPEPVMSHILQKARITDHVKVLGKPLTEIKRGIAVVKGREQLFKRLEPVVKTFIASPSYNKIYSKWYGEPIPYWTVKKVSVASMILLFIIVFVMALWRYRSTANINRNLELLVHSRTKKLSDSELRYKQMFRDNQAVKLVIDPKDGRIVEANKAACRFYQYSLEKLLSIKITDINMLSPEKIKEEMQAAKTQNRTYFNFPHKLASGEIRDVEVFSGPINFDDGTIHLFSIIYDITERKQVEERFRALFEDAPIMYVITRGADKNPIIDTCNDAFIKALGYEKQQIVGQTLSRFYSEESKGILAEGGYKKALTLGITDLERVLIRKDGRFIHTVLKASPYKFEGGEKGTLAMFVDISERKQAEVEKENLERRLQQAQRMEAIGTLAGGIAHDFNNILAAILGYAEMARDDSSSGSTVAKDLDKVLEASNRAKGLVKRILAFSRQDDAERFPIQPSTIVKEAINMLRPSLPATIEINQNIAPNTGLILADPTQINQILMNLGTNAFHAMEETGGKLDISLKETSLNNEDLVHEPDTRPGTFIQLSVCDSGPGMTPEIKERIFDPYFTTKGTGKGTGMGLSIVHGIVKSYGGFISLYTEFGEGTAFNVFLPVIEEGQLPESNAVDQFVGGKERVLFIDDEEILAEMGKDMLERLGYHVTKRNSSLEALKTFQNQPNLFDIVITDQTMPGMTGSDLAIRMMQIRADIPIILCTGYSSIISEEKAKGIGIKEFALKPLAKKDIAQLIRKVLDTV